MKLFGNLLAFCGSATAIFDVTPGNFVVVPDGYYGSFEGFNITYLIEENESDQVFRNFEEKFHNMLIDPLSTQKEFKRMTKVKMVTNMILYLQDDPLFGKYFNYGCHCFRNEGEDYLKEMTIGKPQDRPDNVCRDHSRCHSCVKMDYVGRCDVHKGYSFQALKDSVTNTKYIQCTNDEDTCLRSLCECDKALAYDLADSQGIWTLKHHTEWGAFKADQHCDIFNDNRSPVHLKSSGLEIRMNESVHNCCGEFPRRYPYHSDDGFGNYRKCCNGIVYNPDSHQCCDDDQVREIGDCFGVRANQW